MTGSFKGNNLDPFSGSGGLYLNSALMRMAEQIERISRIQFTVPKPEFDLAFARFQRAWIDTAYLDRLLCATPDFSAAFARAAESIQKLDLTWLSKAVAQNALLSQNAILEMDRQWKKALRMQETIDRLAPLLVRSPVDVVSDSLASMKAALDVSPNAQPMVGGVARLSNSYLVFANRQVKRIAESESERQATIASAVLDHASGMLSEGAAVVQTVVDSSDEQLEAPQGLPPRVSLFGELNRHMARQYASEEGENAELAVTFSLPAEINALGVALLMKVLNINIAFTHTHGEPLFAMSQRAFEASVLIPHYVADNAALFGQIVDALYFLLWEGSGGDKGKLDKMIPGPGREPLQALRNIRRGFRHALELGSKSTEKQMATGDAFRRLINRPWPLLPAQWKATQKALYADLLTMLDVICDGLANGSSS